MTDIGLFVLRT